jgi:hypothetical protein
MNSPKKTGSARKIRLISLAAGSLCGLGLLNSAIALPPLSRGSSSHAATEAARSIPVIGKSFVHPAPISTLPLDLRPPKEPASQLVRDGAGALASASFPSAIHHLELGKTDLGTQNLGADSRTRPSAFGADEISVHEMSQGQIIAQRIQHMHREGLPVAHLWESKLAALSIGLNQRGKPGLWFTQRMH